MSTIHGKITIRAASHLTTLPVPCTPFPPRPTSLPAGLTNCPAPGMMAHFPSCRTLLSARPTHCPTRLVHTPALQTPPLQGPSTGIPKEKREVMDEKKEKGAGEKGQEKGGQNEKEVKKAAEAPQTPGQRMSILETVSLTR